MSHFALVDENDIVVSVIVAEQDFIDTLAHTPEGHEWIQTSYNTRRNQHIHRETGEVNAKPPLRGNYAGVGYLYLREFDVFVPPKPYPSWVFDEATASWEAPIPQPTPLHIWDEESGQWQE